MKIDNKQRLSSYDTPAQVPANILNIDLSHAVSSYHGGQLSMSDLPPELPVFKNGRLARFVTHTPKPRAVSMPANLKQLPSVPKKPTLMSPTSRPKPSGTPARVFSELPPVPSKSPAPVPSQLPHLPSQLPQVPSQLPQSSSQLPSQSPSFPTFNEPHMSLPPKQKAASLSSHDSDSQFSLSSGTNASSMSGTSSRILQFVDTYVSESSDSIISKYERIVDPDVYTLSGVTTDSLFSDDELQGRQLSTRSEKSLPELPLAPLPQLKLRKRQPRKCTDHQSLSSAQSKASRVSSNSLQESKAEIKATVLRKPFEYCLDSSKVYESTRFPSASLLAPKTMATGLQRPPIQPRCVTAAPDFQSAKFAAKPKTEDTKRTMLLVSSSRYQEPWKRVLSSKQLPATPDERCNRFAYI
ncbi:predicted protein [Meyerozyma guilliermondii ATCC 6260]|uniref:Uncharacterized protein n=1 Tax=Meyerozyma guilliermondii (strain ATCC 6260 / CBS 566 / DSM 6381 / JCM 1539 / NBRC 10279 / NRRL Y-324) TaxID=294746 RepID=A5DCZ4_PICGU|nr:uncharacterized protein PGUG_01149 [Meyerozyma guilliermondii ATCC 6260]EDK37051.2 predicted protein [Meyerozyma guilliermondii ATCC 6260]